MNASTLKLVQGSTEWLDYRRRMFNASETAAVLGISPWMTPYQLWMLKTGRSTQEVTAPMARGTRLEPEARAAYEQQTGQVMQPLVMQDGRFSASLDGINLAGDLTVEVKCPFRGKQSTLWREAVEGRIPAHYAAQVQHQLMVAGATTAHLWVYADSEGILLTVRRDEVLMDTIRAKWDEFAEYLDTHVAPPLTDADSAQRDDPAWVGAALAYQEAKRRAEAADEALEAARKALVGLARHPRETGGGVSVVRLWKAGAVQYAEIPELRGVDLSRYRGEGRQETRVTVAK